MKRKCLILLLLFVITTTYSQEAGTVSTLLITGKVIDEQNNSLPGVTVTIKGTQKGTMTGLNGSFIIQVPSSSSVLVFGFIGMTTNEIEVGKKRNIIVTLKNDIVSLASVVVVGYGTQQQRDVTGAISKIDVAELVTTGASSFDVALQGKASGLQVTGSSGLAGSASRVRIRGTNSISAGGEPLYVIDGVPLAGNYSNSVGAMDVNPLADINPDDIASIEILKDAGSAGIYGSRGANGVILITTKRGKKKSDLQINFSSNIGVSTPTYKPDILNTEELLQIMQEGWDNDGGTGPVPLAGFGLTALSSPEDRQNAINTALKTNTDWWDLMTRTGFKQDYNLSVKQGFKKLSYYVGGAFSQNKSYVEGSTYKRLAMRGNIDYTPIKLLKIGLTSSFNNAENNIVKSAWDGGIGTAMTTALPFYAKTNKDESLYQSFQGVQDGPSTNPYTELQLLDWTTYETRTINNLTITYTPITSLVVRTNVGLDYKIFNQQKYEPAQLTGIIDNIGTANEWKNYSTNIVGGMNATYYWDINTDNKITALVGFEIQHTGNTYTSRSISDVDRPLIDHPNSGGNLVNGNPYQIVVKPNGYNEEAFVGMFSRLNYTLLDRYIFQVIARIDGASQFGINNKYGFFPALSGAWRISDESFMKPIQVVNNLKLRLSWGVTGNANIPSNQWRGTYSKPAYGYNGKMFFYPKNRQNPDLKWENLYNTDVGLEFGLFSDRISGDVAYYYKLSTDVLISRADIPSNGFDNYWDNVGKISNQGVEVSLTTRNIEKEKWWWHTTINFARNWNRVEDIGGLSPDAIAGGTNDTRIAVGHPVGANYLVRFSGVDPTDGLPIWLDKNGYKTKVFNTNNDRVIVGSTQPDIIGGFDNSFSLHNLTLSIYFTFSLGGNIYDNSGKRQSTIFTSWNLSKSQLEDRWQKPGDKAKHPRVTLSPETYPGVSGASQYNSTLFLYDASYLRLKTLSLNYSFPKTWTKMMGLKKMSVNLNVTNLFTVTSYNGDPELNRDSEGAEQNRNIASNTNYLTLPQEQTVMGGFKIDF